MALPADDAATLAVVCIEVPLMMLAWPETRELTQRLMYLTVFVWLWRNFLACLGERRTP